MHIFLRLRTALASCLAAATVAACTSAHTAPMASRATPVRLSAVQLQPFDDSSNFMGTLKSRKSSVLQPLVSGTITKIFVDSGAVVSAKQPLIEIDPEKQRASLSSSMAADEQSEADLTNAEQTFHSLEATRASKQATLQYALRQIDRYSWLNKQGAVSKESVDQLTNNLKVAQADLKSCEAQIEAQKALIKKMRKKEQQARADEQLQQVQLQYYTIKAPFCGVVGDIPLKLGEYVESQTKLTTVTENKPLEVYIYVPAERAPGLYKGMPVELADSTGKNLGSASVFFISPDVDMNSQTVLVKALYANPEDLLRSNQTVTAKVIWKHATGILVPTYAVSHISGQDFVFVADGRPSNATAKQKPVVLGEIVGNNYLVKSGLNVGEQMVVSGIQNLIDGMPISPQE